MRSDVIRYLLSCVALGLLLGGCHSPRPQCVVSLREVLSKSEPELREFTWLANATDTADAERIVTIMVGGKPRTPALIFDRLMEKDRIVCVRVSREKDRLVRKIVYDIEDAVAASVFQSIQRMITGNYRSSAERPNIRKYAISAGSCGGIICNELDTTSTVDVIDQVHAWRERKYTGNKVYDGDLGLKLLDVSSFGSEALLVTLAIQYFDEICLHAYEHKLDQTETNQ